MSINAAKLLICTSILPPHRGGEVPSPMGMDRNGRTDLPRGLTKRSPPLFWTVFSLGCSLTGFNWAASFVIDWTPLQRLLILALLLISGTFHLNPGPSVTILAPGTPAPSATLICQRLPSVYYLPQVGTLPLLLPHPC